MGHWIDPLNPSASDICIEDIAHSLAMSVRFTGHVRMFYSTAQHSYLVSYDVPTWLALTGLLHDASEAYMSDFASPLKRANGFGELYKEAEGRLEAAIAERFNLPYPWPSEIKESDLRLLRAEQRDLMPNDPSPGSIYTPIINPWGPEFARRMFITRYNSLTGENIQLPEYKPNTPISRSLNGR